MYSYIGNNEWLCRVFFLSAKTRQGALDGLKTAMATRILHEFISDRRMTITDSIERCLKKGTRKALQLRLWLRQLSTKFKGKVNAHSSHCARQGWGAASSSLFSLPAVYPAGFWHWERGGFQDPETYLQKHFGWWISQHTSQTGSEYMTSQWYILFFRNVHCLNWINLCFSKRWQQV